jgi:hypothetical protein
MNGYNSRKMIGHTGRLRTAMPRWATLIVAIMIVWGLAGTGGASASGKSSPGPAPASPAATCPGTPAQCFADVLPSNPFFDFANRVYGQGIVTGYPCGGPGEPCDGSDRPYYRPNNTVTRGQMSKFVDQARRQPGIDIEAFLTPSDRPPILVAISGTTGIESDTHNAVGVIGSSDFYTGVEGLSYSGAGVYGHSDTFSGVLGQSNNGKGVSGISTDGDGVFGQSDTSSGVIGYSNTWKGVAGLSTSSDGVYGEATAGSGVLGHSTNWKGAAGISVNDDGVYGESAHGNGVKGHSTTFGVVGESTGGVLNAGVLGTSDSAVGVWGTSTNGAGVYGASTNNAAGYFQGNVTITGTCTGCLGVSQMDDPLDPANKYLNSSAVESPDMMNIYNGNVTLNDKGEAVVQMPDYFQALNRDFRYQLTAIGAPGPNLYIAEEISDNRFKIAGGQAGSKVSWQVTGIRHDPYSQQQAVTPEVNKPAGEQGTYLHPGAYGQPESKGLTYQLKQQLSQGSGPTRP